LIYRHRPYDLQAPTSDIQSLDLPYPFERMYKIFCRSIKSRSHYRVVNRIYAYKDMSSPMYRAAGAQRFEHA